MYYLFWSEVPYLAVLSQSQELRRTLTRLDFSKTCRYLRVLRISELCWNIKNIVGSFAWILRAPNDMLVFSPETNTRKDAFCIG